MLGLRSGIIPAHIGKPRFQLPPPRRQPFQRAVGLVDGPQRSAQPLIRIGQRRPSLRQRRRSPPRRLFRRTKRPLRLPDSLRQSRSCRRDSIQPIEPDQPLRRLRPAFAGDKPVPTPHLPVQSHQPLPNGQHLPAVALRYCNLR